MRYIGNKTKLLGFIGSVLDGLDAKGGHAFDAFAGTASVGRFLKGRGYGVSSCDIMTYSYVFQRAYVEVDQTPDFLGVLSGDGDFRKARQHDAFSREVARRFGAQ